MSQSIRAELESIDLGDARLNKRSRKVLDDLAGAPQAMINTACGGWAETKAAYRFFDNRQVDPQRILEAHREKTSQRIGRQDVVLLAQDTTEVDVSDHPPEGAGPLTAENRLGFLDHSQAAFTPEGLCLGVVDVEFLARSHDGFGQGKERQSDPLETKESHRWLEGYRRACQVQDQHPDVQVVSVADCEGDLYEIYVEAAERERPADFVMRAGKTRRLPQLDPDAPGKTYYKMRREIERADVRGALDMELPRTPQREARGARLEIRAQRIRLKEPHLKGHLPEVEVNVVLVREIDPPDDGTAVEWLLITSLPIDTFEQVLRVIDFYVARWPIEIYFRTFKTGCRVEEIQLERADRLLPCLMLYKIIAWRVMHLTYLGRECPELPCDVMFPEHEWKPVWQIVQGTEPPREPPSLERFTAMLARLGGHNGRRRDGAPGPQSLWIGLRRLHDFSLAWLAFGPRQN